MRIERRSVILSLFKKVSCFPKYSVRIESLEKDFKSSSSKHLLNAAAKTSQLPQSFCWSWLLVLPCISALCMIAEQGKGGRTDREICDGDREHLERPFQSSRMTQEFFNTA